MPVTPKRTANLDPTTPKSATRKRTREEIESVKAEKEKKRVERKEKADARKRQLEDEKRKRDEKREKEKAERKLQQKRRKMEAKKNHHEKPPEIRLEILWNIEIAIESQSNMKKIAKKRLK